MTNWLVTEYTGSAWASGSSTIPSPRGASFTEPIVSTFEEVSLASGDKAVIIPETKYTSSPIRLYWQRANAALKTKLENYLKAGTGLRLTTHVSGKILEGYITTVDSEWIPGSTIERYNISIDFMIRTVA